MAGIGLRATIEAVCEYEKIEDSNLLVKINRMASKEIISKDEAKDLHAIRFLGNDAAHDGKIPEKFHIILVLRIIQHLISSKYALQDEIKKYLELPITTYEEFKSFINEKIKKQSPDKTFSIPPHKQVAYREWNNLSFPVTEKIHAQELSLPMSPTLTDEQVQYVIDVLNKWKTV